MLVWLQWSAVRAAHSSCRVGAGARDSSRPAIKWQALSSSLHGCAKRATAIIRDLGTLARVHILVEGSSTISSRTTSDNQSHEPSFQFALRTMSNERERAIPARSNIPGPGLSDIRTVSLRTERGTRGNCLDRPHRAAPCWRTRPAGAGNARLARRIRCDTGDNCLRRLHRALPSTRKHSATARSGCHRRIERVAQHPRWISQRGYLR